MAVLTRASGRACDRNTDLVVDHLTDDDDGVTFSASQNGFTVADLRHDQILLGVSSRDGSLDYVPRSEFVGFPDGCD